MEHRISKSKLFNRVRGRHVQNKERDTATTTTTTTTTTTNNNSNNNEPRLPVSARDYDTFTSNVDKLKALKRSVKCK